MTEEVAGRAFPLSYWQPRSLSEIGCRVTCVEEVVVQADLAARLYQVEGAGCLAGVSLWRGVDIPGKSLGIGIGPTRWAIIHTDDEFFQTVTRGPRSGERTLRKVQFDEYLEIPGDCFIDRELAINTVSSWMNEEVLLPAAGFSNDLFG
ncbi:hypothetical protein SRB5_46250 [Streptomyces sp. RB5]|uniref:Uncharacterized protein n=1 Tax=Streptomyces smaragdinus TaxID=2585196 RepID=A0A7K0CLU0_9ACTN|nr:hypothetical protein [Streptomyces smaragdinus]MQY14458.1 hypothetical protein [Streptomyces smaragdinus]